jgi:hypothetical protein
VIPPLGGPFWATRNQQIKQIMNKQQNLYIQQTKKYIYLHIAVGAGVGDGVGAAWEQNFVVSNANWRSSAPLWCWEIQSPKKSASSRTLFKTPSHEFSQDDCPERWPSPSINDRL